MVVCFEVADGTLASMYRERWASIAAENEQDPTGLGTTIQLLKRAVQNSAADEVAATTQSFGSEACLLAPRPWHPAKEVAKEEVCGPTSFDSSDAMTCVETYKDGDLRWVCN